MYKIYGILFVRVCHPPLTVSLPCYHSHTAAPILSYFIEAQILQIEMENENEFDEWLSLWLCMQRTRIIVELMNMH